MRRIFSLFAVAVGLSAIVCGGSLAQAQGYGGYGGYCSGWYGLPYGNYASSDRPSFYALYPPVYYSLPVPRTYGYSPFAYPPGTMTPEIVMEQAPAPAEIINPYVPKPAAPKPRKASLERTTMVTPSKVEPKVIYNPFTEPAQLSDLRR